MIHVAALYVRSDSVYKELYGVDAWDEARDARLFTGRCPVVAHPPCAQWGRMRQFSLDKPEEKALGPLAVQTVLKNGGVLEHPANSSLWTHCGLPKPGDPQVNDSWTLEVEQFHWGHRAEKRTWLFIVGVPIFSLPNLPFKAGTPSHCIRPTKRYPRMPSVTKREREHSPVAFAEWLCEVARSTRRRRLK